MASVDTNSTNLQFDQAGNVYYLNANGQLIRQQGYSRYNLDGIRAFGVSGSGKIHAVFNERPSTKGRLNNWYTSDVGSYIYYRNDIASQVVLSQEEPVFVDVNSKLIGYGNICVT